MQYKYVLGALLRGLSARGGVKPRVSMYSYRDYRGLACARNVVLKTLMLPHGVSLEAVCSTEGRTDMLRALQNTELPSFKQAGDAQSSIALQVEDMVYVVDNAPTVCCPYKGVMQDKVVVITGAAQGFGKGIADALVSRGAFVYIADINKAQAHKTAEGLCATYGTAAARALEINCADEASVKQCAQEVMRETGGVDLLISNAGVVISGDVESIAASDFLKTAQVNYYGYFLLVKYFSPCMKYQHYANPEYYSDIIQMNSKSGLQGSVKNSAYAGSKFGGIGLTQSFALELVEHNIKVNAICPGNFYDGPLWSDPEKGLFVQYLKAGKVPHAKTVAEVRAFYEAKTPMKRGCTVEDVVKGIVYLVDQNFETGQALPISGGQVMLN